MVKYLIIANVVVFLVQILDARPAPREIPEALKRQIERQQKIARKMAEATKGRAKEKDEKTPADEEKEEESRRKAEEAIEEMMDQMPPMNVSTIQKWFELDPKKTIEQGQIWRLLTSAFCHDRLSIWHIVFNMLLLYWFGTRLENMYGSREFLLFYLAAAICSSAAYVGLAFYTQSFIPAIGASGAVMGVMMLYTIFYPFETFMIFWILPMPLWALLGIYVLFDLHPVLLAMAGDKLFTGIAHAGHLGGLAFGFLYWKLGLRLETPLESGKRRRFPTRNPYRIKEPSILIPAERDPLKDRVDELLKKISEHGQASLTEEERQTLFQASAKYRRNDPK
jgi:membrane associated rhomboid family serine protease